MESNNSGCGCGGCSGCLLMFIAFIVVCYIYVSIDMFIDGIGKPEVPDVEGKSVMQAEQILEDAGFTNINYHADDANYSDMEDLGYTTDIFADWIVTDQTPEGEDKAAEDDEIDLICTPPSLLDEEEGYDVPIGGSTDPVIV